MVVASIATFSAISILQLRTVLHDSQVNNAYFSTLTAMRQARQSALAERRVYLVTFTAPGTILHERRKQSGSLTQISQVFLSYGMQFRV